MCYSLGSENALHIFKASVYGRQKECVEYCTFSH